MKFLILSILMAIPLTSLADDENILEGVYADCTRWSTLGGVETSKRFSLLFTDKNSLHLSAYFFEGSGTCEGAPKDVRSYSNFTVLEDSGNRPVRIITAQDIDAKMYFKFVLSLRSAIIYTGDSLPVRADPMRVMILKRTN